MRKANRTRQSWGHPAMHRSRSGMAKGALTRSAVVFRVRHNMRGARLASVFGGKFRNKYGFK
jgi:hypothetical protein